MKIIIFCEQDTHTALELIGKARAIAPDAVISALYEGKPECMPMLFIAGADEALSMSFSSDDCAQGTRISEALMTLEADIVLFPATVRGRFLSAWAAAKLNTGLTADCTELAINEAGLLLQTRPAYGGNIIADILCKEHKPQMASVRPGVFPQPEFSSKSNNYENSQKTLHLKNVLSRMELISSVPVDRGVSLQTARVIVVGGKGIGSKQGFDKLHELAELLGGAVGATRSAVDAGWIAYEHQIGLTGVTVRPDFYLTFGVSGLVQHVVGMSGAGTVISVNLDRNAPIFTCSDYGIIADWRETVNTIIQFIKERKNKA